MGALAAQCRSSQPSADRSGRRLDGSYLDDSDLLLVDLGEPRFRHDGIYVLRRDSELAVKRLQRRPDGSLNIISDNPAYESSIVAGDSVHIIGR